MYNSVKPMIIIYNFLYREIEQKKLSIINNFIEFGVDN